MIITSLFNHIINKKAQNKEEAEDLIKNTEFNPVTIYRCAVTSTEICELENLCRKYNKTLHLDMNFPPQNLETIQ